MIRFMQVSGQFKKKREAGGLTLKDASKQLKVPQYRLAAAEGEARSSFQPDVFWKYCEFLGLGDFVARWIDANRETAKRMGIV